MKSAVIPTVYQRLLAGLSAATISRGLLLSSQIASIPILIGAWGAGGYGEWIALTALATYLSYGGFGIAPALRGVMVERLALGGEDAVRPYFRGALITIGCLAALMFVGFSVFAEFAPVSAWLNISRMSVSEVQTVQTCLGVQLCCALVSGVLMSALASFNRYALVDIITATRVSAELLTLVVAVKFLSAEPAIVASMYAVSSVLTLFAFMFVIILHHRAIVIGSGGAKSVVGMLGAMGSTVATHMFYNGILVQAPRIILAATLGPAATATYTVCTQLTRIARIVVEIPSMSPMVEMASAFHRGDRHQAWQLLVLFTGIATLLAAMLCAGIILVGPLVVKIWSAGHIVTPWGVVLLLALGMLFQGTSLPSLEGLISLNQTSSITLWLVLLAVGFAGVGGIVSAKFGLAGMAALCMVIDATCALVVVSRMERILGRTPGAILGAIVKWLAHIRFEKIVAAVRKRDAGGIVW